MDENNSIFGTLALLISDIALLDAAYMVFSVRGNSDPLSIGFLPWLIMAVASFTLYWLFLRRERSLPKAVLLLAASYAVTVAILLIFFVSLPTVISTLIAVLFWSAPQFRIYTAARTPPTLEKLTARLEGVVVFLLFLLLVIIGMDRSLMSVVPCAASMFLCLIALIIMRTARSSVNESSGIPGAAGMRGAVVILAFFLLIGAAVAVFLMFVSASFGDTIAEGIAALFRVIKILFDFLTRILSWLASLLPAPEYGGVLPAEMVAMEGQSIASEEMILMGDTVPVILISAIAAAIVAIVIITVIKLRRYTLGGKRKLKTSGIRKRRTSSRAYLLRRWLKTMRFIGSSIIHRNTPQGVFVQIERWGRSRRCGRTPGETQHNYLARLSAYAPEHKNALLGLADALDECWYGDPLLSMLPRRELVKLRKSFYIHRIHKNAKKKCIIYKK